MLQAVCAYKQVSVSDDIRTNPSGLNFMYDKISQSFAKKRDINSDRFLRTFTNVSWFLTYNSWVNIKGFDGNS